MIEEPCKSAHLAAMDIAKSSDCLLSYDPNLRLPLWPSEQSARDGIMSIWNQADIIKVPLFLCDTKFVTFELKVQPHFNVGKFQISKEEITFLTEGDDPDDDNVVREKLLHPNLKLLIVTEGTNGCRYYTKVSVLSRPCIVMSTRNITICSLDNFSVCRCFTGV